MRTMMPCLLSLVLALATAAPQASRGASQAPRPGARVIDLERRPELFLHDDALVSASEGVTVGMGRLEKHPGALVSIANLVTIALVQGVSSGDYRGDLAVGLAWGLIGGVASALIRGV